MALLNTQLSFNNLNQSIQVGDILYYASMTSTGDFTIGSGNLNEIGPVTNVNNNTITVLVDEDSPFLGDAFEWFVFFSKDNVANMASILGYYGEVEFKNNSDVKAELFATSCEISESSK